MRQSRFWLASASVALATRPNTYVVEFIFEGTQTNLNVAETFPVGKLGESHAEELIETRETADSAVAVVAIDAFLELIAR